MRKFAKVSHVAIVVVPVCLLIIVLLGISQAYLARWRAEQFLAVLEKIQVGTTKVDTAYEMVRPFHSYMPDTTNNNHLQLGLNFDNHGLVLLRLAPYTEFRVSITFMDGVVVEKQAREFQAASGCGARVDEKLRGLGFSGGIAPNGYPNHIIHSVPPDFPGIARHSSIEDDNTYGEAQRHADWNFNLSCITRFRGCADARLMLPDARPTE
jgi:hypothetical protein